MKHFVLIQKGQQPVYPQDAADRVRAEGFAKAAKHFGVGESTLRKYLHDAGYRFSRKTSWQVERLPWMEGLDASTDGAVRPAEAGTAEPAGSAGGLGGVETGGVQAGSEPVGVGASDAE